MVGINDLALNNPRRELFNTKVILPEEQQYYYLIYSWENNEVHRFPKGISPKENVIVLLEFYFAYNDVAVQHVTHFTTRTSLGFHF